MADSAIVGTAFKLDDQIQPLLTEHGSASWSQLYGAGLVVKG